MSSTASIRVLIADDHEVVREGLAAVLRHEEGLCLVGEACNGSEAVSMFRQQRPDVLVMDVRMPVLDGLSTAQLLRKEFSNAAIVLLSTYEASEDIYQATRVGVKSYLLKESPRSVLLQAIRAAAGESSFPPEIVARLAERLRQPELTTREKEILGCVVSGKSNQEIGSTLFIAEGTVKAHLNAIYAKMGVSDRTQATTAAIKRGLVPLQ